jgi:hypothetical protein
MLGFLLRLILWIVALRFIGGLVRALTSPSSRDSIPRPPEPRKPIVDRSSAIDVPFTEEPGER